MKTLSILALLAFSMAAYPQSWRSTQAIAGSAPSGGAITFNPVSGYVGPATSVTVTSTVPNSTVFCTTDGTPANAAATIVGSTGSNGGPILLSNSTVLNCTAVQGAVEHQQIQTAQPGWKICTPKASSAGTPPSTACVGVGNTQPSTWTWTWGPTLAESVTGPSGAQILAPFSGGGCDSCTMLVQRKIASATVDKTYLQNNEADSQQFDATHKISGVTIEHNMGLQCEQGSDTGCPGQWAIGGYYGGGGHWVCTAITDSCPWPVNTPIEFATQAHWFIGDTGCGGLGCTYYDWFEINGFRHVLSGIQFYPGFPLGALANGNKGTWGSSFGSQDQLDIHGGTATVGRNVTYANVTAATYSAIPVLGTAVYTIHP